MQSCVLKRVSTQYLMGFSISESQILAEECIQFLSIHPFSGADPGGGGSRGAMDPPKALAASCIILLCLCILILLRNANIHHNCHVYSIVPFLQLVTLDLLQYI
jgi:hypothetical protein